MVRIAINGFGRIGRLVYRLLSSKEGIEVVAINDLVPVENLAYLLQYDSTHGKWGKELSFSKEGWIVEGKETCVLQCRELRNLPWSSLKVDYVVESTGLFKERANCEHHLRAGARRVLLSAPPKGEGISTFVFGVNHEKYDPGRDTILSNASCTTNCLAPLAKVLLDHFGIEEGLMTTVHATTATQPVVDGPSKKDWRGGRSALQNIIPASTGAAQAVGRCLPELAGKLTGMAFRVPLANVSVVDLTVRLSQVTQYEEICAEMKEASEQSMAGVLSCCQQAAVSSDFIGDTHSSIFDHHAGMALNDRFYKLIAWYDNEMGYSSRIVDLIEYMAEKE